MKTWFTIRVPNPFAGMFTPYEGWSSQPISHIGLKEKNLLLDSIFAYINGPTLGQAILVDGAWGSGKSHFIKRNVIPKRKHKKTVTYISAMGLADYQALESEIVAARLGKGFDPLFSSNTAQTLPKGWSTVAKLGADLAKSYVLSGVNEKHLLIIDDLERCPKPEDVFAIANYFAESKGTKVILVASLKELNNKTARDSDAHVQVGRLLEKTVRYTYAFEQAPEKIISILMDSLDKELREFLESYQPVILDILLKLNCSNLRIVFFAADIFQRIYTQFSDILKKHPERTEKLIYECFGLSIAVKSHSSESYPGLNDLYEMVLANENDYVVALHLRTVREDAEPKDQENLDFYYKLYPAEVNHPSLWDFIVKGYAESGTLLNELERWTPLKLSILNRFLSVHEIEDLAESDRVVEETLQYLKSPELECDNPLLAVRIVENLFSYEESGVLSISSAEMEALAETIAKKVLNQLVFQPGRPDVLPWDFDLVASARLPGSKFDTWLKKFRSDLLDAQEKASIVEIENCLKRRLLEFSQLVRDKYPHHTILQKIDLNLIEPSLIRASKEDLRMFGSLIRKRYAASNIKDFLGDELLSVEQIAKVIKTRYDSEPSGQRKLWLKKISTDIEDGLKRLR